MKGEVLGKFRLNVVRVGAKNSINIGTEDKVEQCSDSAWIKALFMEVERTITDFFKKDKEVMVDERM